MASPRAQHAARQGAIVVGTGERVPVLPDRVGAAHAPTNSEENEIEGPVAREREAVEREAVEREAVEREAEPEPTPTERPDAQADGEP